MPGARHDSALSLRTVDREELRRKVVGIGKADRNDHVARPYVELREDAFLNPELLDGDLAAALDFLLHLACFLIFLFHSDFGAAVLEFYLHSHGPSAAEIVAEHDYYMRKVEAAVAVGVLVVGRVEISVDIVAVHII